MPQGQWSAKRERQYADIKQSLLSRGRGEKVAEEIAARTVNKTRAQHGEAKEASTASLNDMSPAKRGGEPTMEDTAASPSCTTSTRWPRR